MYDIIIIGGGVAGYSAAIYAKRYEMNVLIITEMNGGTIITAHLVENYPGFTSISGYELAKNIIDHAKHFGIEPKFDTVKKIEKKENIFYCNTENEIFESKSIILATGTKHLELGIKSEQIYKNKGVSYCATCDGAFFKDKVVGVVGGSDSAIKEALLLSQYASKVYIFYRKEKIRPEPINRKHMEEEPKIKVINNVNVKEIFGDGKVQGVKLDNGDNIKLDGLFIEIGRVPQSELAKQIQVNVNDKNNVIINKYGETNIKGFFAAGDITDTEWKQAIIAAAEGSYAANSAYNYVMSFNV